MQAKIAKVGDGFGLLLPKELLDACGIGEKATVIVQNRTLIVAAQDWRPRQGWDEALERTSAATADEGEDQETLAHWTNLPAAVESPRTELNPVPEAVLREEPTRTPCPHKPSLPCWRRCSANRRGRPRCGGGWSWLFFLLA